MLRVVLVDALEERLANESELAVLTALATGDALLTTVSTSETCCALISYKQERRVGATDGYGELTLDGSALRGIVAAARSLKVDGLWLDAWCYRSSGAYDHSDFCRTLREVSEGVEAVVWLPRPHPPKHCHPPPQLQHLPHSPSPAP